MTKAQIKKELKEMGEWHDDMNYWKKPELESFLNGFKQAMDMSLEDLRAKLVAEGKWH